MLIESVKIRTFAEHVTYDVVALQGPELGSWSNLFKALAAMKGEVTERFNVGTEQVLIILVSKAGNWEIEENIDVTVVTCPLVDTAQVDTAIIC